ncbi:biotin--protein ligase [Croceibacterium mercuriale]|uniref:Biotin--protein ligase n=1 Tax=Croceibacterium mercuriale TaxID=1572751 RepID=A0A0B2C0U6_9SPHN|nr:biotin--[acetyl-CoA-carboxylase] ligase [Croceibacterium mercuriale]KHL25775.1 biotin--protein ligase [Croceibacterium mercuriale]
MIEIVADTASTNADLLQRRRSGLPAGEGCWLVADRQHGGRGRQGRAWLDAPGNFMGSTIIVARAGDPPATTLPLACGLAVLEALVPLVPVPGQLQLKWPNDVLLRGGKIAGILLERESDTIIAGIGVNLATAPLVANRQVGTLGKVGPAPDRDSFARNLATAFVRALELWRAEGAPGTIARWLAAAHPVGSALAVHDDAGLRIGGRFAGLEPDGALRLAVDAGAIRVIRAGDVVLEGCEA